MTNDPAWETYQVDRSKRREIYELIRQGHLPCIQLGVNQKRVSEATLIKWLAQREQ